MTAGLVLDHFLVFLRIYIGNQAGLDAKHLDLVYEFIDGSADIFHGDIARVDDLSRALILIAGGGGHYEQGLYPIDRQPFDNTVAGRSQTACDMGRKLPTEHQDSHKASLLIFRIR